MNMQMNFQTKEYTVRLCISEKQKTKTLHTKILNNPDFIDDGFPKLNWKIYHELRVKICLNSGWCNDETFFCLKQNLLLLLIHPFPRVSCVLALESQRTKELTEFIWLVTVSHTGQTLSQCNWAEPLMYCSLISQEADIYRH